MESEYQQISSYFPSITQPMYIANTDQPVPLIRDDQGRQYNIHWSNLGYRVYIYKKQHKLTCLIAHNFAGPRFG